MLAAKAITRNNKFIIKSLFFSFEYSISKNSKKIITSKICEDLSVPCSLIR